MNRLKIIYSDGTAEAFLTPMGYSEAMQYAQETAKGRRTLVRGFVYVPAKREAHRPIAAAR